MSDLIKLIVLIAIAWVLLLAVPIAAALVGTALALWALYFVKEVADEELDDDGHTRNTSDRTDSNS